MTRPRLPYVAETWQILIALVAFCSFFPGLFVGLNTGYHQGQRETRAALKPDIEANALEIAVLNERIVNLQAPRVIYIGRASYYAEPYHGRVTKNGEIYDKNAMTMAVYPGMPLNVWYTVRREDTGQSIRLWANDWIPKKHARVADLSEAAARALGMLRKGVAPVYLEPEVKP